MRRTLPGPGWSGVGILAALFALIGCGAAALPAPSSSPSGWVDEISDPVPSAELEPCERALVPDADEHATSVHADLDGAPGDERTLHLLARVVVIDATCRAIRLDAPLPEHDHPAVVGPTLGEGAWADVSEQQLRDWASTDVIGGGRESRLSLVRAGTRRHLVHVSIGAREARIRGWVAIDVGCDPSTCRAEVLGHVEWIAVPGRCAPHRHPTSRRGALLWIDPRADGTLVLTRYADDHVGCEETSDPRPLQ